MNEPNGHPNRFTLERLSARDLSETDAKAVADHVATCASCSGYVASLAADDERFQSEIPLAAFRFEHARRQARRERRRWSLRFAVPALAAATATLLVVLTVQHEMRGPSDVTSMTRLKGGGAALGFAVLEGGHLRPGVAGEELPAAAEIQLFYATGDFGHTYRHLAVLHLDASGKVTVLYPESGDRLAPLPAGRAGKLPFSLKLDGASGVETFWAVFAREPESLAEVVRVAELAVEQGLAPTELSLDAQRFGQAKVWLRKP